MKMLNDSVVWIIGGGSGIGRAIAVMAAEEGARVWISGRRIGALKETSRIAAKKNKRAGIITLACDAVDPAQVKTAAADIINKERRIDSLIISVGWAFAGSLQDTPFETWRALEAIHLDSMFLCCREALRGLKKSARANIVIIGSVFGLRGKENRLAYCTMKGGVVNFVRALALDLAGSVRVNSICPGWVETDMSMALVKAAPSPKSALSERHGWHPMGRGGSPREVADLCVYLVSEKAAWMTGQNIALDGGYTAR